MSEKQRLRDPENPTETVRASTSRATGACGSTGGSGSTTPGSAPTSPGGPHVLHKKASKGSVQIREPPVSETRGYHAVKNEEKHGPLHRAIPVMPLPLAIILCMFNILLPGTGTLFSSLSVFCCGQTRLPRPVQAFGLNLIAAFLQMLTFLLIVGWIWSILWGMTFVQLSLSARQARSPSSVPYYVRRQSSVE